MTIANYTLNIGLKPTNDSTRTELITRREVLAALRAIGFFPASVHHVDSNTEPTLVITGWFKGKPTFIFPSTFFYNVAFALYQDCIAVYNNTQGFGWLAGPNADKWGDFNADYFITESQAEELSRSLAA